MDDKDALTRRFEAHRPRLRAVAYRMLGSSAEADDAVQETWVRYARTDTGDVENLAGWLTTVVSRVCLNVLRARTTRREEPLDPHVPDPVVTPAAGGLDPEQEVVLADSVGLALLVILESLGPAERVAFVLHDMFSVPFDDIAPVVDRTPEATRQLASRARRRVEGRAPSPGRDPAREREVVDAFFAAARDGDLGALVAVLDPDVVLRSDRGALTGSVVLRGPDAVARQAAMFAAADRVLRPVVVNGAPGVVVLVGGRPVSVMEFAVAGGRIVAVDALADPERVGRLALP
jgi:RNA polymerase sigma-70 factor (ECF subfamily)